MANIFENLYKTNGIGYSQGWTGCEVLVDKNTKFQNIKIISTTTHGKVLLLDDVVQLTELDEFFYSEAITHPAIFQHDNNNPIKILIIGGGDGAVAEEALKHKNTLVTMVEIDEEVVIESAKHFQTVNRGVLTGHDRLELIIADGLDYLMRTDKLFDVIITDRPDPIGPAKKLFEKEFYELCKNKLDNNGILIAQNGIPLYQLEEFKNTKKIMNEVFMQSGFFFVSVPTYVGGYMALSWGSSRPLIDEADMFLRLCGSRIPLKFFNSSIYSAIRACPGFLF